MKLIKKYMRFNFFIFFASVILSTSSSLFLYQEITASKRRLSVLFLFTVFFYIIITVCMESGYWKKWKSLDWISQLLFIIAIPLAGFFIMNVSHLTVPKSIFLIPQTQITIHGLEANPPAQEQYIEINGIMNGGKWVSYESVELEGNFEIREDSIFLYGSNATLTLNTKIEDQLLLNFVAGPQSGIANVSIGEETVPFDLYAGTTQEKLFFINRPVSKSFSIIPLLFFSSILGFLIFFISFHLILSNWKPGVIFKNAFVPAVFLILCAGTFLLFSAKYLPQGVNSHFLSLLIKYLSIFVFVIYISIFIAHRTGQRDQWGFAYADHNFAPRDLVLLLLPLTPVVQYIINNKEALLWQDSIVVLAFFILYSGIYIYLLPLLFSIFSSTKLLMITGLAFVYTMTNMAIFSRTFSWYQSGNFIIQFLFLMGTFTLTVLFYSMKDRRIFYYFILISFIVNGASQFLSNNVENEVSSPSSTENPLYAMLEDKQPVSTPNIYLLVYDAYVSNETMAEYGINNAPQEEYLVEKGFKLYPHTYSVSQSTTSTMGRVLNVSSANVDLYEAVSGDSRVHKILKTLGYKNYGLFRSDYFFKRFDSSYDYSTPEHLSKGQSKILISAILIGEFRFDLGMENFEPQSHEEYVSTKQNIFKNNPVNPVFIYSHSPIPAHSQNSGKCLPNETQLFKQRLDRANIEMMQDIDIITETDPDAIVIIAGDHGPYLTKNCYDTNHAYDISEISRLDIQDRFGTFLAIRWPTEAYEKYDDIVVLQDIFPSIFSYLYQDENILESRIDPLTLFPNTTSGATVDHGIIQGGMDDGEPLFLSGQ